MAEEFPTQEYAFTQGDIFLIRRYLPTIEWCKDVAALWRVGEMLSTKIPEAMPPESLTIPEYNEWCKLAKPVVLTRKQVADIRNCFEFHARRGTFAPSPNLIRLFTMIGMTRPPEAQA